jgi:hypothetical protein
VAFGQRTEEEERRQNLKPLVLRERIRILAPEEDKIYFVRPPFLTVTGRSSEGEANFWIHSGRLDQINPELAIFIGDFGTGSDSPILLDYRNSPSSPTVIRLNWRTAQGLSNIWVECTHDFDDFANTLNLP